MWRLVQRDLRDSGIDVYDKPLLRSRPWPWLRDAILGLLDRPYTVAPDGYPVFTTRVQEHFDGPARDAQRAIAAERQRQQRGR